MEKIKIQELVGSFQTYELELPSHKSNKSLALKIIHERTGDSSDKGNVEKEVVYLAKNIHKFLKMNNIGKLFDKGRFSSSKNDKREFKKKSGKESSSTQEIVCYECNGHAHLKKECPNYLRGKGKVFATTLSESESTNSDAEGEYDSDGNYSAFMAITTVDSRDELKSWLMILVYIPKEKKLMFWMMRMCTSTKVKRIFKKCTMRCLKIVANMPKLQRVLLKR